MKIIVFSDSHGRYSALEKIYTLHPDADLYLHLGDGERDFDKLILAHNEIHRQILGGTLERYKHIAGNCDFASLSRDTEIIDVCGHRIYAEHGHISNVKHGYAQIKLTARRAMCDIAFFGHTHIPHYEYDDGLYLLNPGSAAAGRYAIADITDKGVLLSLAEL